MIPNRILLVDMFVSGLSLELMVCNVSTPTPTLITDVAAFVEQIETGPHDTTKSSDGTVQLLILNDALALDAKFSVQ